MAIGRPERATSLDSVHINSDLVFGLAHLLDKEYRPALADLPDQKLWRVQADADYGALNALARGRLDLGKVTR